MVNIKEKYKSLKNSFDTKWGMFVNEGKKCYDEFKNPKTRHKQIPNVLTASRLFAPFFIIPAALIGNLTLTGIFALGFAATDAFDGYFARKYNCTSEFGRELDALTDKVFAITLLVPLVFNNPLLLANLIMEFVIGGVNVMSRLNNNKPKTAMIGKVKTGALSLTLVINYIALALGINPAILNIFTASTLALQVGTALKYLNEYKKDEDIKHQSEKKNITPITKSEEETTGEHIKQKNKEDNNHQELDNTITTIKIDDLKKLRDELKITEPEKEEEKVKKLGSQ